MGKRQYWHREWTLDMEAGTATHSSGLVVRIAHDKAGGYTDMTADNLEAWQREELKRMNPDDLVRHAHRLFNEAKRAWEWQLEKRAYEAKHHDKPRR
jgi:hypothetical protein